MGRRQEDDREGKLKVHSKEPKRAQRVLNPY